DGFALAARGGSLPSPKRAEPARLRRCSSVKYAEYSPSSRLAAGPATPISARSDFHHGLLAGERQRPQISVAQADEEHVAGGVGAQLSEAGAAEELGLALLEEEGVGAHPDSSGA